MKRERVLELRVQSLKTLGQAVAAMKSLSAHHFRMAREALEPVRIYRRQLDRMLASTGASLPAGQGPLGLLVLGADLGFCGAYNTRVARFAADARLRAGPGPTFCVGHRAAIYLRRHGVTVDHVYPAPTSTRNTTDLLLELAQAIIAEYVDRDMRGFDVIANGFLGVGAFEPRTTQLLPVQCEPTDDAPRPRYGEREQLAAVAVRELLFVTIVEQLTDALASEHSARLVATQAAEQWLEGRIGQVQRRLSAARREVSTQEVIETSTGARMRRPGMPR